MAKKKSTRRTFGNIKVRNGKLQASYKRDGKTYYGPHLFMDRTQANLWLNNEHGLILNGTWSNPATPNPANSKWTFGTFAEHYIETKLTSKALPLRESTKQNYRKYLAQGLNSLHAVPLHDITKDLVTSWYMNHIKAGKVTTTSHHYKFLHAVMAAAIDERYYKQANPCQIPRAMSATSCRPVQAISMSDVVALANAITPRYKNLLLVMANGALRFGEATALTRKDIQFIEVDGIERAAVQVARAVVQLTNGQFLVGPTKSEAGIRRNLLNSQLTDVLKAQLADLDDTSPEALVFPSANGAYLRNDVLNTAIKRALKKLGINGAGLSSHTMRRSGATALANVGANISEVKEFLGDSSDQAALRYIKSTDRTSSLLELVNTGLAPL